MPVRKDASGRRYVQAEVEVPGTPEEVWQAIATGPGISSWFVPADVTQGRDGVPTKMVLHFGPGTTMDSVSEVTAWEPPHRFAAESRDDLGPGAPPVATEWTVEARSGGTCVVRVVHSWFASSDEWDNQFDGHEQGWPAFFRILRLYLTHFGGQTSSSLQLMGMTEAPISNAWEAVIGSLGLSDAAEGRHVSSPAGAPRLAGLVERLGPPEHPELLIRLVEPTRGIAHFFAMAMGGQTCLPIRLFLYGEGAAAVVEAEEPVWQAWINAQLSAMGGAGVAAQESR